jgi:hypothetical protein
MSPEVFKHITGQNPSRLQMKWSFVGCPFSKQIQVCKKAGSNPHWLAIQPAGFNTGIKSMQINGQTTQMVDSAFYFKVESVPAINLNNVEDNLAVVVALFRPTLCLAHCEPPIILIIPPLLPSFLWLPLYHRLLEYRPKYMGI